MDRILIEQSDKSPFILIDPEKNVFEFAGNSRPENVRAIYYPVIDLLTEFFQQEDLKSREDKLVIKFKFTYFNSSSAKFIFDILAMIRDAHQQGVKIAVEWYYMETDDDMKEVGEEFSEILDLPFKYIMIQE